MSLLNRASHSYVCPPQTITQVIQPTSQIPLASLQVQQRICATLVPARALNPVCPPTNVVLGTPDPFTINSFGGNPSQLELGSDLLLPAFTATYNRVPTSISLDDDDGNPTQAIPPPGAAFASGNNYTGKITPNESVTWTLTADEGVGAPDTAQATTVWRARHWFGFHASPGPLTEAQVLAMTQLQTGLTANITFDVTFAAVAGLYFHHVWHDFFEPEEPAKYITDGIFPTGVADIGAVTITPGGAGVPSGFTARNVRSNSVINTGGQPIRLERRA